MALKTKISSSRSWTTLTMKGHTDSCPRSQAACRMNVQTNQDDGRETLTLCSGHFVVPGAHDIDWVLGAPNFVKSARSTELLEKCLGHYGAEVSSCLVHWILSGQIISYFYHFFALLPHSRPESGHHNFLLRFTVQVISNCFFLLSDKIF